MAGRHSRHGGEGAVAGSFHSTIVGHLREVVLLSALYLAYCVTRVLGAHDVGAGRQRAGDILQLEGMVHLDVESQVNAAVTDMAWLAVPMDYWYAVLHYVVTPAALVWLYLTHRSGYARRRNALVISSILGLFGYLLFPTAPPRLMGDPYLDTLARYAHLGWWADHASAPSGLGGLTNELAAMPSLHVGWAVWVAWALQGHVRTRSGRVVLLSYPLMTTAVVVCTGNHWLLDCIAGLLVVIVGITASNVVTRVAERIAARHVVRRASTASQQPELMGAEDRVVPSGDPRLALRSSTRDLYAARTLTVARSRRKPPAMASPAGLDRVRPSTAIPRRYAHPTTAGCMLADATTMLHP